MEVGEYVAGITTAKTRQCYRKKIMAVDHGASWKFEHFKTSVELWWIKLIFMANNGNHGPSGKPREAQGSLGKALILGFHNPFPHCVTEPLFRAHPVSEKSMKFT